MELNLNPFPACVLCPNVSNFSRLLGFLDFPSFFFGLPSDSLLLADRVPVSLPVALVVPTALSILGPLLPPAVNLAELA